MEAGEEYMFFGVTGFHIRVAYPSWGLSSVNGRPRDGSVGCNGPSIPSFLHSQTWQSLAWGLRLTVWERGRQAWQ